MMINCKNVKKNLKQFATACSNTFATMYEQECLFAEQDRLERAEEKKRKKLEQEEHKRKEDEYQKKLLHTQIQQFYDTQLRELCTHALNALPPHMRLASTDIDAVSIFNTYRGGFCWQLKIAVPNDVEYSRSRLHQLRELLNQIFTQILADAVKSSNDYIIEDRNRWQTELRNFNMGLSEKYPNEYDYLMKYQNFYNVNFGKLYGVNIFDITAHDGFLFFTYDVSLDMVLYFHPDRYFALVNSI